MAIIGYNELLEALRNHEKYKSEWEMGVPAETSLVIVFGKENNDREVDSIDFATTSGHEISIGTNSNGVVKSMEIY